MRKITILFTALILLGLAKTSFSQEWVPIFKFNSINGRISTSNGDKIFTYKGFYFLTTSYEAMLSLDNGNTWTEVHNEKFATAFFNEQEDLYAIRQDNFPGTNLYFPQSVFLTTDDGNNWTITDTVADNIGQVNSSVFRMDNSGTLYTAFRDLSANTGGFKYSVDDGLSWTLIPTFISGQYSYTDPFSALLTSDGDFLITTYNDGVFKSSDAGVNWTKVYETFITLGFLNEHPSSGDLYVASYGAILKSTDNGENWEELVPDPWMAMNIIEFEITSDGTFWFANAGGIYKSDDCIHWEQTWDVGGKSPESSVNVTDMSISDNYIYAVGSDSSIYRKARTTTSILNIEDNISLRVYPNPVKDFINLSVENLNNESYSLKITDLNGRIVYEEILAEQVGTHKINVAGLKPGIYIVSVNTSSRTTKKKIIVTR